MRNNVAVRNEDETHRLAKQKFGGTKASSRISAVGNTVEIEISNSV